MIEEAGGYGFFQVWTGIVILLAVRFGTLLMHAMPFLLQYPDYICYEKGPGGFETYLSNYDCTPHNFCNNGNIRAERIESKSLLQNWVYEYNLTCAGPGVIPAFYLALYLGLAFGGLIIGPMTDSYGKKVIFLVSLTTILSIYCLILVMEDYSHLHIYIFVYAFALAGAIISGLLLTLQHIPKKSWPIVILSFFLLEGLTSIGIGVYFRHIN